ADPGMSNAIVSGPPTLGEAFAAVIAARSVHLNASQVPASGSSVESTVKVSAPAVGEGANARAAITHESAIRRRGDDGSRSAGQAEGDPARPPCDRMAPPGNVCRPWTLNAATLLGLNLPSAERGVNPQKARLGSNSPLGQVRQRLRIQERE